MSEYANIRRYRDGDALEQALKNEGLINATAKAQLVDNIDWEVSRRLAIAVEAMFLDGLSLEDVQDMIRRAIKLVDAAQ